MTHASARGTAQRRGRHYAIVLAASLIGLAGCAGATDTTSTGAAAPTTARTTVAATPATTTPGTTEVPATATTTPGESAHPSAGTSDPAGATTTAHTTATGADNTVGAPFAGGADSTLAGTTSIPAPTLTITPGNGATAISPIDPVTATATDGTVTFARLINPAENITITGVFNDDHTAWHSTQPLGYGKTYQLTATVIGRDGSAHMATHSFTTVMPPNMTLPYFEYPGRYPIVDGAIYGVGFVPVVHFDEPISDRAAAQATLHVSTTPHVDGRWYWADSQNVHFRPRSFWPAGTTVTIDADVYGVEVSNGLYGQADRSISFVIGRKQVTVADDNAPEVNKVRVYNAQGDVIRTMNTSMGRHGGTRVDGKYINFYTMDGTYMVLDHQNPEMMSSASYGLPADAPGGYEPEPIYYSTRISTGGIFLHQLTTTIWAQNHGRDVSHGCLNLNHADAQWFYTHSIVGDPVIVHGTAGAPKLKLWQGGDWSIPWPEWIHGGAYQ